MLILENLILAIAGLKTNKMRSLLTMLGIIIGISSVISIVSIGDSISESVEKTMKDMGMNNLLIEIRGSKETEGYSLNEEKPEKGDLLTIQQIDEFENKFKDKINAISISLSIGTGEVRIHKETQDVQVEGISEGYTTIKKLKMKNGRSIEEKDVLRSRKVAVIPFSIAEKISGDFQEVIGSELKLLVNEKLETVMIIGIYDDTKKNSGLFNYASDTPSLYLPVTTAGDIKNEADYRSFEVMPKYGVDSEQFTQDINKHFEKIYEKNPKWKCVAYNPQSDNDSYTQILNKIKMAIAVIAGISLLVGGIGVMNIMLVSVTERTKEIGIRKALGAKDKFIKLQFIVEAMIICGIGGLIGVSLGLSISTVVAIAAKTPVVISFPVILVSVAFSMSIGVFFGYYPANKAASLDPIDALRYE